MLSGNKRKWEKRESLLSPSGAIVAFLPIVRFLRKGYCFCKKKKKRNKISLLFSAKHWFQDLFHFKSAISKALPPPVPCAGVKGGLNYIHAEVPDPNSGLSKWLPESICARWVSLRAELIRRQALLSDCKTTQKLCQIMSSCSSFLLIIDSFNHLFCSVSWWRPKQS